MATAAVAQGEDVQISVVVSATDDSLCKFQYGSFAGSFGVYILGPWGPVKPDASKIRPGGWMHGQMSASKRVAIKRGRPFSASFKLSDFFSTVSGGRIRSANTGFTVGKHQLNVKFFPRSPGITAPIDSGPVEFVILKPRSFYEKQLAKMRIGTETHLIRRYLKSLIPTPQQRKHVKSLIRQLGDRRYAVREKATRDLVGISWPIQSELAQALSSGDPEVRFRIKKINSLRRTGSSTVLYAVLQVIAEKKRPGLTSDLLTIVPLCAKPHLKNALQRALLATAGDSDYPILSKAIRHENSAVRSAVVNAIQKSGGRRALNDLAVLLKDRDENVRVAAARAVAESGDRTSLPVLLAMLKSKDVLIRIAAATTLRQASGKHFGFTGYDNRKSRATAVARWKEWVRGAGKNAKLRVPSSRMPGPRSYLKGHTLLAYGNTSNKVAEYDNKGTEVWSYPARNPRSAEKLENGNVLIAECSQNRVIEVDRSGRIIWQFNCKLPLTAQHLTNGNLLIAQFDAGQVIEVNRKGEIVWKHLVKGKCCSAQRLSNGNTLIAAYGNSVLEVSPHGLVVWQYPATRCHGCRRLDNGNVLICDQPNGRVIEVTRAKKTVWECRLTGAVDAFRLPNGNTLISGSYEFVEMTRAKNVVWRKRGSQYGTARR